MQYDFRLADAYRWNIKHSHHPYDQMSFGGLRQVVDLIIVAHYVNERNDRYRDTFLCVVKEDYPVIRDYIEKMMLLM
jgi:hypothetical protein